MSLSLGAFLFSPGLSHHHKSWSWFSFPILIWLLKSSWPGLMLTYVCFAGNVKTWMTSTKLLFLFRCLFCSFMLSMSQIPLPWFQVAGPDNSSKFICAQQTSTLRTFLSLVLWLQECSDQHSLWAELTTHLGITTPMLSPRLFHYSALLISIFPVNHGARDSDVLEDAKWCEIGMCSGFFFPLFDSITLTYSCRCFTFPFQIYRLLCSAFIPSHT